MKLKTLLRVALLGGILTTLLVISASAAVLGAGTVKADSGLRLRAQATTSAKILGTAPDGATVVVLEDAGKGWYKVSWNATEGFMSGQYLDVVTEATLPLGFGKVTTGGSTLNLRAAATTESESLESLPDGTVLELTGVVSGWYQVVYGEKTGFVSGDYVTVVPQAQAAAAAVGNDAAATDLGNRIVQEALKYLGCRYVYGGRSPSGFDCSGFASYVYQQCGISIPRSSSDQWLAGPGTQLWSMSQLQPGDLFFVNDPKYNSGGKATSHVCIYIGNGQVIHASTPRTGVIITDMNVNWLGGYFVGGRHVG